MQRLTALLVLFAASGCGGQRHEAPYLLGSGGGSYHFEFPTEGEARPGIDEAKVHFGAWSDEELRAFFERM